ncbi:MAG: hypothetical protein KY463_14470 [Actinobacteria bacterium]|nr:hypothetical protein [Actinomycetota bacterium]
MGTPTATERRELAFAGVARQAAMVRVGAVTPRELVETALDRIATLDPQLNAFRVVFAERALREADEAAKRLSTEEDLPLLGVPIAVKDDTPFGGEARVCGSHAYGDPEPEDADFVRLVRAAGAIVVGITRTPELAAWPFTETVHGGITRNPWDPQRTSGGSSGGSASAVAAALVPAATASDGAGSIRIPAACCGLFGLKVTRGAITTAPADELFGGLSVYGFLTRDVADAALLYEVATDRPFVAAARRDPARLRIALSTRIPPGSSARLSGDWRTAAESTADLLRSLGHSYADLERQGVFFVVVKVECRYRAPARYDEEFDDVFVSRRPVRDPTLYASVPAATDPAEAPDGCESWFVLVNAPAAPGHDWNAYGDHVLERMAAGGLDVRDRIRARTHRSPAELERETGAVDGAIYGDAPHGRLGTLRRPPNRVRGVDGLWLVGGTTHPGGGLPLVMLSAQIVARAIGPA